MIGTKNEIAELFRKNELLYREGYQDGYNNAKYEIMDMIKNMKAFTEQTTTKEMTPQKHHLQEIINDTIDAMSPPKVPEAITAEQYHANIEKFKRHLQYAIARKIRDRGAL